MSDARGRRGQTEGIGVILLTAIVILGVGTFGAFYLQSVDDQASSERVPADLQVVATNDSAASETTIVVTHRGGETIDDGVVHLRNRGSTYQLLPDSFESGDPTTFEAGQTNTTNVTGVPKRSELQVLIVENVTSAVVFRSTVTVRGAGGDGGTGSPSDSTPPSVSLTQPTGGETVTAGSTYTVNWSASDGETSVTGIDIAYSDDGGSTWSTVVSGTANDGSYNWPVPDVDINQARIRVRATDEGGNTATDKSGNFSIEPAAAPSVQSATVQDAPIDQAEAVDGLTRDVTITFTEPMNQDVTPRITLTGISGSYSWNGDGTWADSQTFVREVSFNDNDDETTATVEVGEVEDIDGNSIDPDPDTSETFRVDTAPPTISNIQTTDINDPDGTANDGVVNDGDTVEVTADVNDGYSVDAVEADASDFGAGTVTLSDGNGDGTYTATFTVEAGSASSDGSYALDLTATDDVGNSRTVQTGTVELDTTAPAISESDFTASNPSGKNVEVAIDSNEMLSDISVDIDGPGAVSDTLTRSDFSESQSGGTYTYTAAYSATQNGEYTLTLNVAEDETGNDGGDGEIESVGVSSGPTDEDGDGGTQDEQTSNVDASTSATTSGGAGGSLISFDIENPAGGGGSSVTVTKVSFDSTTSAASSISDKPAFSADGTDIYEDSLDNGNTADVNDVTIADGKTVTFEVGEFRKKNGGGGPKVDMRGEKVTLTFYFADGSQDTYTLSIPNGG